MFIGYGFIIEAKKELLKIEKNWTERKRYFQKTN